MGIIFLSFVVITGAGGMVSLAQAAFASLGALVAAALLAQGVPFLPAALIGGLSACVLGLIVALPSLRLGGLWLALATLAAGFMADEVLFQIPAIGGPASGRAIARPVLGPLNFNDQKSYGMLLLLVFGIVALLVFNLLRSPTGRLMSAVRSSEAATETSGASTIVPKFVLFGVSAAIAGFGGALLAANNFPRRSVGLSHHSRGGVDCRNGGIRRPTHRKCFHRRPGSYPRPRAPPARNYHTLLPTILFGSGHQPGQKPGRDDGHPRPEGPSSARGAVASASGQGCYRVARSTPDDECERGTGARAWTGPASTLQAADPNVAAHATVTPVLTARSPALDFRSISAGYDGVMADRGLDIHRPPGPIPGHRGTERRRQVDAVFRGCRSPHPPPTSGTVLFDGVDISSLPAHERAQRGLILAPEYRRIFLGAERGGQPGRCGWRKDPKAREAASVWAVPRTGGTTGDSRPALNRVASSRC